MTDIVTDILEIICALDRLQTQYAVDEMNIIMGHE